ncbi:DarT ssDNA thymidine ADP-ribosyltransferase family protein [Levilactobacillus cerevisiae]|uniref:DarT ssDNA thymidine ADP-ribosyltransferase family protein n=1 Tax=Levilactobacillus cerevisiae TaxID=1704076 RepID=UPI000F769ED4|nr:DarT ssDNA thymidine ADP-ribosyltransferase family protein [Levilactobacillus cerevisiae]
MDYQDVVNDLTSGKIRTGLSAWQQKWIPRFAYHFTDILNAVSILKMRRLLARDFAESQQIMVNDNAGGDVIAGTPDEVGGFVRLYFRPKTPTQFHNEGFQVEKNRQEYGADCPIPVFFLFDLPSLLSQPDVQFTAQSLAKHHTIPKYQTPEEFSQLPFDKIFHDRAILPPVNRDDIIPFRQAEIIVPKQLGLETLRHIFVRSIAEKETLQNLLHDKDIYDFDELIQVRGGNYFYMNRNFIDDVELTMEGVVIKSSVNQSFPREWGPIDEGVAAKFAPSNADSDSYLQVLVERCEANGQVLTWPDENKRALLINKIRLRIANPTGQYTLKIYIDGHIAYEGKYQQNYDFDLPF